jgi:hypothetical protein
MPIFATHSPKEVGKKWNTIRKAGKQEGKFLIFPIFLRSLSCRSYLPVGSEYPDPLMFMQGKALCSNSYGRLFKKPTPSRNPPE